jgi:hypothetical protein
MTSSLNHGFSSMGECYSSSSSSDDEILKQLFVDMDRQRQCAFACAIVVANLSDMFNDNELEEGVGMLVNLGVGIQDVFVTMQAMPRLLKTLTNFKLMEFDKLPTLVMPTIVGHA